MHATHSGTLLRAMAHALIVAGDALREHYPKRVRCVVS
jgi:hypothetical protein